MAASMKTSDSEVCGDSAQPQYVLPLRPPITCYLLILLSQQDSYTSEDDIPNYPIQRWVSGAGQRFKASHFKHCLPTLWTLYGRHLVMLQFSSEPKFEPELHWTEPKFGSESTDFTEPDLKSSSRFNERWDYVNRSEPVRTDWTNVKNGAFILENFMIYLADASINLTHWV